MPKTIKLIHPITGECLSRKAWAEQLGISYKSLLKRLRKYPDNLLIVLSPYYLNDGDGKTISEIKLERKLAAQEREWKQTIVEHDQLRQENINIPPLPLWMQKKLEK